MHLKSSRDFPELQIAIPVESNLMNHNPLALDKGGHVQKIMTVCPEPKKVLISPLGWSITGRLLCAAVASALLWLAVAWAIGWLA